MRSLKTSQIAWLHIVGDIAGFRASNLCELRKEWSESRLREDGVYLIIGGLGIGGTGIGSTSRANSKAKLALLGRSGLPPNERSGRDGSRA